jgi:hypothetical protein
VMFLQSDKVLNEVKYSMVNGCFLLSWIAVDDQAA